MLYFGINYFPFPSFVSPVIEKMPTNIQQMIPSSLSSKWKDKKKQKNTHLSYFTVILFERMMVWGDIPCQACLLWSESMEMFTLLFDGLRQSSPGIWVLLTLNNDPSSGMAIMWIMSRLMKHYKTDAFLLHFWTACSSVIYYTMHIVFNTCLTRIILKCMSYIVNVKVLWKLTLKSIAKMVKIK